MTYPFEPFARPDRDTSKAGRDDIRPVHKSLIDGAAALIEEAGSRGMTADEVAAAMDANPYTMRARTAELRAQCRIKDSGLRRQNIGGRKAIVWIATTAEERATFAAMQKARKEAGNG